ncbi:hypothetical protein ACFLUA_00920 [Chloroflexota bacterium]
MNVITRFILILTLGTCLCASCQQISTPHTAAPQLDPDVEEYVVYNALLESKFAGADISQILFVDQTDVNNKALLEQDLAAFQGSTPLEGELINSFIERNKKPYPLEPALDFGMDYQLLSQDEVDELRSQDEASGWILLYEKFPNSYGFVYLSRVGFSADFSQALVYMSTYHYERLMEGGYYLMIRQDDRWVVEASYEWQS